jgi:anaerobic selenocysteine-containing dehydrogenase
VYPLEFLPRKADNYMNSTFANHPGHQRMESRTKGVLEMHATDAIERGVANGDEVEIFNARGRIRLKAQVGDRVGEGVVAARLDWSKIGNDLTGDGANVNALTSETLTDMGGGATFYSTLVEVRRCGALRGV